ncbi:TauD/TfdA family dioxygenase [Pedobacter sp. MR22-3]|uniref:TauD/TfdA family dioxygenase n=1 Tax=Pedobacter TaxID=84567 RepID=UPI002248702C|nr:TauD/TfdA family dioxygenase [Pedobacter sp. MR22-3]MCX2584712.1 TauD/TfdA family dioxygenase [Pedobacter sp. MR22-3]
MFEERLELISGSKILLHVEDKKEAALDWIDENKSSIDQYLSKNGALLIRGLAIWNGDEFGGILARLFGEELNKYTYRSTPRTELGKNVYTATEYHKSEVIPQHNEVSYSNSWPMRIGFLCLKPADYKGNTPISDSRLAYQMIPKEIKDEFEKKKVMYVRNYSKIDLPWQEVFQTEDKNDVEHYCENNNLFYEWLPNGVLRTRQINQASMLHPGSGEMVWFNQAHLFHISNLDEEIAEGLIALLGDENIPRNAYFGDGTPIDPAYLSQIRAVYESTKFSFQWQSNDLLLLDNMLYTHGREEFDGTRQVLVGMARPYTN